MKKNYCSHHASSASEAGFQFSKNLAATSTINSSLLSQSMTIEVSWILFFWLAKSYTKFAYHLCLYPHYPYPYLCLFPNSKWQRMLRVAARTARIWPTLLEVSPKPITVWAWNTWQRLLTPFKKARKTTTHSRRQALLHGSNPSTNQPVPVARMRWPFQS